MTEKEALDIEKKILKYHIQTGRLEQVIIETYIDLFLKDISKS